ncbi:hypothetical protein CASFOL_012938 [Castilleja foliolosa]|uniref:Uncharacterized protein n=1 Tax=Castilleja foliolosa TaxID=1961234 RepID=A0ABD3DJ30_9LAMI
MAEFVVGPVLQVVLEKLLTLSLEEIDLVRHFKNDLENLRRTFKMVNNVLHDAETRQVDSAVKSWLTELEDVAFDADNLIDEFNYHLLSKKVGAIKNKTVTKKVQSFFSSSNDNPISYRLKLGRRIKDINEKLKSINQQASEFGLQTRLAGAQAPVSGSDASGSMETDSFTVDPIFLGRENDVSRIVEKLIPTTPSPDEQVLSVLPIVGMGGLGKTTLAKKVLGDEKIISHFGDNRVWVYVSRNFDVRNILKNIITSLTKKEFRLETREDLLKELEKHLRAKRYMLVLDDVWNEDREMWGDFVNSLTGISSATGSFIIVTSRSEEVASIVKTLPLHKLESLSEDDCWSIIKAKAFNRREDISLEFEIVGRNIARRCQGLPLAAKVVGGLVFEKSKDEWLEIEKNWLSDFGDNKNHISKILKLSFDNLSSPSLKKCFAYCSIFPKGYKIEKQNLIELWMAEGFLQTEHQRSHINMETTGSKNFNLLLRNSLLQVARSDDYDNITHCNMHDLVHDLTFSILSENVTDGVCQCRYIGYESSGDGFLSIPKGQERYVRTLFFSGKVSDIRFSDFESLRTLTLLSEEDFDELPTSVRELKHLRYLDISKTKIRSLPDSIGELYHLQTLRSEKPRWSSFHLEKLPNSLSCLISLRHIHIPKKTALPPGVGKLTSLQTLPHFYVGGKKGCGISELGNLKDLKGGLTIHNLENVRDKNEAMSADLLGKSGIYVLRLVWDKNKIGEEAKDQSVLEGLKPHPNLKRLEICGFKGKSLSLWEGFNSLVEIKLEDCSECEELPMLGHLPRLKFLYLSGLTNVKSIRYSFYGNIDSFGIDTIVVVFPELERLELHDMPNLKEWDDMVVFPRLKYLQIYKCMQLRRAPSDFPCLEELVIDGMESSLTLENICGIKLTSLTCLVIREIEGLVCLPEWLFSNNHNLTKLSVDSCPKMMHLVQQFGGGGGAPSLLRELNIYNCSSLRELPHDLHNLSSLDSLFITGCPDLKSIPYNNPPIKSSSGEGQQQQQQQQQCFTSLRDLCIWECKGLTNLPIEMVESCAPSLEGLTLNNLSSLTNMGMVIECLHKMTRLRYLAIFEVPKFSIVNTLNASLSLREMELSPSTSWSNNVSYNETAGAMLLQCYTSLGRLSLYGMEDWVCLPDQLQHLTSLEILELSYFGMEALPEWFGNLESLEIFFLSNCKKLRHLPSKQAMLRLSKLTRLNTIGCPLLLKEKRSNDDDVPQIVDSEWPKISHIPEVEVDGRTISSDLIRQGGH